jgi:hypothetical protein
VILSRESPKPGFADLLAAYTAFGTPAFTIQNWNPEVAMATNLWDLLL